jgi:hypothetical protein
MIEPAAAGELWHLLHLNGKILAAMIPVAGPPILHVTPDFWAFALAIGQFNTIIDERYSSLKYPHS